MIDELENFIKTNRKAFNDGEPSGEVWAKIAINLQRKRAKRSTRLLTWLGGIAAVLTLSAMALLYIPKFINADGTSGNVNSEIANKETKYRSLIIEKKDSLAIFASSNPDLYRRFTADLFKLDEEYIRLKDELQSTPNRPVILEAMIKNREIQLKLLKQQLLIINQVDSYNRVNQI
ncbi:hypothetical protein ABIB40_003295 [Pedobacter sp. UYP30]|uniref:hypothetical protein n=1 Tax=Pedobacter sp. UYP30 TaxID=1756400 RepID=UPI003395734C